MTLKEQWQAVDRYFIDHLLRPDEALSAALEESVKAGLPPINVSPLQGKMLHLLVKACGARRVLEIGTLGGYSTIWMARALPADGSLVTLEYEPKHAAVARANFARAGVEGLIELRLGPAIESLPKLEAEGRGPFDFIFIDADKVSYPEYLDWSLRLARPGTMIIADNVVRNGGVADANNADASVRAVRRFTELVAANPRLSATTIQTVGGKGYDGFTMAVVTELR